MCVCVCGGGKSRPIQPHLKGAGGKGKIAVSDPITGKSIMTYGYVPAFNENKSCQISCHSLWETSKDGSGC